MSNQAAVAPPLEERPIDESGLDRLARASQDGRMVSEETYWREFYLDPDHRYEWSDGRLEEMPVSDHATFAVYEWFFSLLRFFLLSNPIGKLAGLEMGFRLALSGKTAIRRPDLGLVLEANPHPLLPLDVSYHGIFDLCIEALSDQDKHAITRDLIVKKAEYAIAGVPEYLVLHHEPRHQAFFTLGARGTYVPIMPVGGVIHSRVLPGFRFRIEDLQRLPDPYALHTEPVYRDFVLPEWGLAEERAQAEAERAQAEAERAEQAERERDELRAQLDRLRKGAGA